MPAEPIRIEGMACHVGQEIELRAWLHNSRSSGKIEFLVLRDGTGICQAIFEKIDVNADMFERVKHLGQESAVVVRGLVRADERSPGGCELAIREVEIVHETHDFPITPKEHGIDFLLRHRHLHLRSRRPWALARLRHTVIKACRQFFDDRGFILVDTPIFSPAAGEEASSLFQVDYFGEPVALSQTGQLYLEAAALGLGQVYCFGPTFRAEKSKTRRHLTEFWMIEPEVAWIQLDELMALAEDFVHAIAHAVLAERREELAVLGRDPAVLERIVKPFVRLSYSDAVDLLGSDQVRVYLDGKAQQLAAKIDGIESDVRDWTAQLEQARKQWQKDRLTEQIRVAREDLRELTEQLANIPHHARLAASFEWGKDLGGSDETIISELHDRPVFVHRYPAKAKAFYMKPDPNDPRVVLNFDLLAPEGFGEIIGGSMREDDCDALLDRIREKGYNEADYDWYLDLRRYGSVPHGGFGLGIERTVAWLAGIRHIRETIAFPRMMGKIYP
jgi:asparaginyl-tRNA synthetase